MPGSIVRGVCCLLILLSLLGPRVAVAFHDGFLLPFLGLLFFPWTVLLYTLAYAPIGGVSGFGWLLVALGALADVGSYVSGPVQRRRSAME